MILSYLCIRFDNNQVSRNKMEIIEFLSMLYINDTNDNSYKLLVKFHKYV